MAGAATPAPATDEGTAPAPDVDEGTTPTATAGESAQRPASVTGESSNSPAATASPSAPLAGPGTDPAPTAPPTDGAIPKDRQAEQQPGLSVCLTVTHLDGVVLARSAFHHSINYRSVVVHGIARQVTDPAERTAALDALVNHVVPGRAADCRPANARELAATAVLRLDLAEVSAKWREGGPNDEPEDLELPHWAGVLPVARHYGTPLPSDDLASGIPAPDYLPGH
ncbi:pyridoxamine 5'-phosphate oxidase family protein [Streptomyces zagrosensis]